MNAIKVYPLKTVYLDVGTYKTELANSNGTVIATLTIRRDCSHVLMAMTRSDIHLQPAKRAFVLSPAFQRQIVVQGIMTRTIKLVQENIRYLFDRSYLELDANTSTIFEMFGNPSEGTKLLEVHNG